MVTGNSSSGATGAAGNNLLTPPGVGSGEGSREGSGDGSGVVPASTVMMESAIVSVLLSFSKTPEKVYGPSATSEPTLTLYVNESTPITVKVTACPSTAAPIDALASVLVAESST